MGRCFEGFVGLDSVRVKLYIGSFRSLQRLSYILLEGFRLWIGSYEFFLRGLFKRSRRDAVAFRVLSQGAEFDIGCFQKVQNL